MRIDLLCTNPDHPVIPMLRTWMAARVLEHDIQLLHDKSELTDGDILYLVSCSQMITHEQRKKYGTVMVLHASDLPMGRGWSPYVWDILAGNDELTLCLITAEDDLDTGAIWAKQHIRVPRHALFDEINDLLFKAELALMDRGIAMVTTGARPDPQPDTQTSYYPRRTPADSRLDPAQPLAALFDQIRVADPDRFPAFFEMHGRTYELTLKKRES